MGLQSKQTGALKLNDSPGRNDISVPMRRVGKKTKYL